MSKRLVELPFGAVMYQTSKGQGISSDTSFLVETVLEEEQGQVKDVLDAGCGNGIISIMLKHYRPQWQITGIEIQPGLVELAKQNSLICHEKVTILAADLRVFTPRHKFNLIVCNPPYYPKDEGRISPIRERAISRHEICCNLEDVINMLGRNLTDGGTGYFLNLSERRETVSLLAEAQNMELDRNYTGNLSKDKVVIYRIKK